MITHVDVTVCFFGQNLSSGRGYGREEKRQVKARHVQKKEGLKVVHDAISCVSPEYKILHHVQIV